MRKPLYQVWRGKTRLERFLERVQRHPSGCWHWTGGRSGDGYGQWFSGGYTAAGNPIPERTHRVLVGLPAGRVAHHTCGDRRCVRPDHIQFLTPSEHGRFHGELLKCGHSPDRRNARGDCRECDRLRGHRRREDPAYRKKELEWHRSFLRRKREGAV